MNDSYQEAHLFYCSRKLAELFGVSECIMSYVYKVGRIIIEGVLL